METSARHRTVKRSVAQDSDAAASAVAGTTVGGAAGGAGAGAGASIVEHDPFRNLLDESAREAFRRPWHRLERGLRLNRLRMYVEEMSAQCSFTASEKEGFFTFLSNALDRKLLNTHKIVEYVPELQKIKSIQGLEVRRLPDGTCKWGFVRKPKADGTRKARKPMIAATAAAPTAASAGAGAGAGAKAKPDTTS